MNNLDIGFYISILLRRLHYVMAVALAIFLLAFTVSRMLPPNYSASAKILAEGPKIPAELAQSTVPMGAVAKLQILQQQITTRESLLELAKRLDIYKDSQEMPSDDDIVADLTSRIKFDQLQLDTQGDQGVTIHVVSFEARQPVLAADVANELVAMILSRSQRERTDRAGNTLQFFNQVVAGLDADLKHLEADILKFKNEHKDTLPESLNFRRSQQNNLQERRDGLEREEADLRSRRNSTIAAFSAGQVGGTVQPTAEQQMLAELNRALAEQLTIFREDSPNIKTIRARISKLQQGLLADRADGDKADRPNTEKVYSGLELQLSDIDDRLAAIVVEKRALAQQIDELAKSIVATPGTETALNTLLRNRENIQTQYNAAITRRAAASTGEQIEMRSDGERFSLLEGAIPPDRPVASKRKMIVILGAVAGLGMGLALVVLLEILNKTVRRPSDLTRLLQTQPLGTIPIMRNPREIRAESAKRRALALLSASMMPAALAAIHYYYMPLNLVFEKLVAGFGGSGAT